MTIREILMVMTYDICLLEGLYIIIVDGCRNGLVIGHKGGRIWSLPRMWPIIARTAVYRYKEDSIARAS